MTSRPAATPGSASAVPPVRCLGCADTITAVGHQCAGGQELVPYGGRCGCPRPECQQQQNGSHTRHTPSTRQ